MVELPPRGTARVITGCGVGDPFADLLASETALAEVDLPNALLDDAIGCVMCCG